MKILSKYHRFRPCEDEKLNFKEYYDDDFLYDLTLDDLAREDWERPIKERKIITK